MASTKTKSRMYNQKPSTQINSTKLNLRQSNNTGHITSENINYQQAYQEEGIIEKLLTSYGFIKCKNGKRLFFHYSEFKSSIDLLNIGDAVKFTESKDRKTGKPVAVAIIKLSPIEIVAQKAVEGTILVVAKSNKNIGSNGECPNLLDGMGRVSYEQEGETFFLPFALEDTNYSEDIQIGDKIYFFISTDERNGNLRARKISKYKPNSEADPKNNILNNAISTHINDIRSTQPNSFNMQYNNPIMNNIIKSDQQCEDNEQIFYNKNLKTTKYDEDADAKLNVSSTNLGKLDLRNDPVNHENSESNSNISKFNLSNNLSKESQSINILNSFFKDQNHFNENSEEQKFTIGKQNWGGDYCITEYKKNIDNIHNSIQFNHLGDGDGKEINRNQGLNTTANHNEQQMAAPNKNIKDQLDPSRIANKIIHRNLSVGQLVSHCNNLNSEQKDSQSLLRNVSDQNIGGLQFYNSITQEDINQHRKSLELKNNTESSSRNYTNSIHDLQSHRNHNNPNNEMTSRNALVVGCIGIVCSIKDKYGFIERADVVREIFFHFSEIVGDEDINLGDDVQFDVHLRNKKEVAVNIRKLEEGTVVFEDVGREWKRGHILRPIRMTNGRRFSDALSGRIIYETLDGPIEISYGEKDPVGDFTLNEGDIVKFNIATDRRDGIRHAINVKLLEDTFTVSKEIRERGFVTSVKEGFGFIRCVDREARMFFHFNELLKADEDVALQQEVEFTVAQDLTNASRQIATRIKMLPAGSIELPNIKVERLIGYIIKEASINAAVGGGTDIHGVISNSFGKFISYSSSVVEGNLPKRDDKVEFYVSETNKCVANFVKVISHNQVSVDCGFVVTLKDTFGFIETANHEEEIYFNFSNLQCNSNELDLGDEVEFTVVWRSGKMSAENIKVLHSGTIIPEELCGDVYEGRIIRQLHTYDCPEYFGLIQMNETDDSELIRFGIHSLVDKRDLPLIRETVKFQCIVNSIGVRTKWAANLAPLRKYCQAKVVKIGGETGEIDCQDNDGRNIIFKLSSVVQGGGVVANDDVEYVMKNYRGKMEAVNISKMSASQRTYERARPERLISRLKSINDDQKVINIRNPKGPDGSSGFILSRTLP